MRCPVGQALGDYSLARVGPGDAGVIADIVSGGSGAGSAYFLIGELVVPFSERLAQEIKAKALSKVVARSGLDSGLWIKDGRSFINIRKANPDSTLEGVRIYRFSPTYALESVTDAKEASFQPPDVWTLKDVVRTVLDGDVSRVESSQTSEWHSAVNPDLLSILMVSPERMSLYGLFNYTQHLVDNKQKAERYQIALWKN